MSSRNTFLNVTVKMTTSWVFTVGQQKIVVWSRLSGYSHMQVECSPLRNCRNSLQSRFLPDTTDFFNGPPTSILASLCSLLSPYVLHPPHTTSIGFLKPKDTLGVVFVVGAPLLFLVPSNHRPPTCLIDCSATLRSKQQLSLSLFTCLRLLQNVEYPCNFNNSIKKAPVDE